MKKTILLIALAVLCSGIMQAQKRTARKKLSLTGTTFYIRNVEAGKCLDIPGGKGDGASKSNGTDVQLWDYDGGTDQHYKLKYAGSGYYYLMPQHCNCRLDVEGCWPGKLFCDHYKDENDAPIQIWSFNTNKIGKWKLEQVNTGQFRFVNKYSGKVLDASAGSIHKNGCEVQLWSKNNGKNQLWELISVDTGQRYEK